MHQPIYFATNFNGRLRKEDLLPQCKNAMHLFGTGQNYDCNPVIIPYEMNSSGHPRQEIEICIEAEDWMNDSENLQLALLHALERRTHSNWRLVCPTLFVECCEPYRTLVIQNETVEAFRAQQHCYEKAPVPKHSIFLVKAEMHMPLITSFQMLSELDAGS